MAQFTLQLDGFSLVDGQVKLALTFNGAKITQTFHSKQALIDWSLKNETLGLDDLVRHAVRKARAVDPTLSNAANFVNKTLTVTVTSEVS
jgi:hypothetical protein